MAGHALGTARFRFEDVALAPEADLLVQPGQGLRAALAGIDRARVHALGACG